MVSMSRVTLMMLSEELLSVILEYELHLTGALGALLLLLLLKTMELVRCCELL